MYENKSGTSNPFEKKFDTILEGPSFMKTVPFSIVATISGILGIAVASCMIYRAKLHDALVLSAVCILMIYVVDFLTIVLFGVMLKNNYMAVDVVGTYSIIRIYCLIFSKGVLCLIYFVFSER